jgi:hypothetical protein
METHLMHPSEISAALGRLWNSLEGTNKMRASLFNLVVISPKNQRSEYVRQITLKVLQRFPSRLIAINVDPDLPPDYLDAHVSLITGAKGEYDIVCDYISLDVSPKNLDKIPFILLPHLLPDLPIYLLRADNPDSSLPPSLTKWVTRTIFDSEVADNLSSFAKKLLQIHETTRCDIADLSWARTENWRELISSTFYSQDRLAALQNSCTITFTYNAYETPFFCHTKIQAIYLQAWLTSLLGTHLTFNLVPDQNPKLAPGTVISCDIVTPTQNHFSFSRDPLHPHQIRTIICDIEKCDIPSKYIFTKSQTGLSLVNEIYHTGTSPHFLKVLAHLSQTC